MAEPLWSDDHLGRREDAEYVHRFLTGRIQEKGKAGQKKSFVLNVDAPWGYGKTFFLKRFQQAYGEGGEGHIVAYVNAWRDDFSEDPFVAVMSAIDDGLRPYVTPKSPVSAAYYAVRENLGGVLVAGVKGFAGQLAKRVLGEGVDALSDALHGPTDPAGETNVTGEVGAAAVDAIVKEATDRLAKQAISDFDRARSSVEAFKAGIEKLLVAAETQGVPMPMYVLVDELDRCRPSFSIAMLERIKHLFDADNVVFVVATDTTQLQHAVRAVYGAEFGAAAYLGRFFDRTYRFDSPNTTAFVRNLLATQPLPLSKFSMLEQLDVAVYLADAFDWFSLSLREIQQAYDLIGTIATVWDAKVPIELYVMVPMAIADVCHVPIERMTDLLVSIANTRRERLLNRQIRTYERSYRDRSTGQMVNEVLSVESLFDAFAAIATTQLPDLSERDYPSGSPDRYARDRLSAEFAVVHNNSYALGGNKPYSLINRYPSIVRKAGRLAG